MFRKTVRYFYCVCIDFGVYADCINGTTKILDGNPIYVLRGHLFIESVSKWSGWQPDDLYMHWIEAIFYTVAARKK